MKDWIDDLNNLLPKGRVSVSQEDILDHSHDAWSVSIKTRQQGKDDFFPDVIVSFGRWIGRLLSGEVRHESS